METAPKRLRLSFSLSRGAGSLSTQRGHWTWSLFFSLPIHDGDCSKFAGGGSPPRVVQSERFGGELRREEKHSLLDC